MTEPTYAYECNCVLNTMRFKGVEEERAYTHTPLTNNHGRKCGEIVTCVNCNMKFLVAYLTEGQVDPHWVRQGERMRPRQYKAVIRRYLGGNMAKVMEEAKEAREAVTSSVGGENETTKDTKGSKRRTRKPS